MSASVFVFPPPTSPPIKQIPENALVSTKKGKLYFFQMSAGSSESPEDINAALKKVFYSWFNMSPKGNPYLRICK